MRTAVRRTRLLWTILSLVLLVAVGRPTLVMLPKRHQRLLSALEGVGSWEKNKWTME
jgi:hypothetical protein